VGGLDLGRVHVSGEGAVGFFHGGKNSATPNSEFRVDEAKLFLESPIVENVYFFCELNLAARESASISAELGEFYLEFADVSRLWGRDRQLNVRAGRLDIPFGEEYLHRDAIDNPLISHSVADFWGVDEGVEIFGKLGKFDYAVAVQNGGNGTSDFTGDKSVAARVGFEPRPWLRMSASAMRTGDLHPQNDFFSAMWFGGGFFRSIGSPATTRFHADMVQGDVVLKWKRGQLGLTGGAVRYGDNDSAGNNSRTIFHYAIEAQQRLAGKLYAAARFSQVLADGGYPLVGNGNFGTYLFGVPSTELWRASVGLGYRWSDSLALKAEYSLERGRTTLGGNRSEEDVFALEAAVRF
jgi:hypothetical protein